MNQFTATVNGASDNLGKIKIIETKNFMDFLNYIAHQVKLAAGDNDSTLSTLATPNDYQTMAQNGDFINECEKLMDKWCKQIEKVEKFRRKFSNLNFCIFRF
jgi:hypothetical protein